MKQEADPEKKEKSTLKKQEQFNPTTGKLINSIPRNVNTFKHLISDHSAVNEDGINWVLTLRSEHSIKDTLSKIPDAPFSCYGKTIISQKEMSKPPRDFIISGTDNLHMTTDLFWHRFGPTIGQGLVFIYYIQFVIKKLSFETGLRNYSTRDSTLKEKELNFRTVPFKDKKYEPYFLAPIKKTIKGIPPEKIQAWEGRVPYPKYDTKYLNVNHNEVKHLYKPQVEMGQINWELGLRGFQNHQLRKDLKKGDFKFRVVGELGPKHQIKTN